MIDTIYKVRYLHVNYEGVNIKTWGNTLTMNRLPETSHTPSPNAKRIRISPPNTIDLRDK